MRFDRGDAPADHHSIVVAAAPEDGYLHAAFESTDVDALGAGAEWLQQQGWVKSWGIGRHVLGSQLFCYHVDPHGFEVEHYTDGDMFDASHPTGYHEAGLPGLYLWGPVLPPHFVDTRMTPARLARVIRGLRTRQEFTLEAAARHQAPLLEAAAPVGRPALRSPSPPLRTPHDGDSPRPLRARRPPSLGRGARREHRPSRWRVPDHGVAHRARRGRLARGRRRAPRRSRWPRSRCSRR